MVSLCFTLIHIYITTAMQEKCNRLVELLLKYDNKMRLAEFRYYKNGEAKVAELDEWIDVDLAALRQKLNNRSGNKICS